MYNTTLKKTFFILLILFVNVAFSQETAIQENNAEFIKAVNTVNEVEQSNNLNTQLSLTNDSSASLPIGIIKEIGTTRYIIAIDTATFLPHGAFFDAYAAIKFPDTDKKIAFAAKNILFNPKGVNGGNQARLMLVSEHSIKIGNNVTLKLKPDGTNFIDWDCNGFKSISLKGYFEFNDAILQPAVPNSENKVTASFQIVTTDIHNFLTNVNITPFKLKGVNDVSFSVTDAIVDMSELVNAPGAVFPDNYPAISQLGSTPQFWKGFLLKQLKITFPKELSKETPREISFNNFVIDNTGVTGNVLATNLFAAGEGTMNGGWRFSVDQLSMQILCNHIQGGSMAGTIEVPHFSSSTSGATSNANNPNGLTYTASIYEESGLVPQLAYVFNITPKDNLDFSLLKSKINLLPSSQFTVTKQDGKFIPSALLSGSISTTTDVATLSLVEFQNIALHSQSPYMSGGVFSFLSSNNSNKVAKYPLSISDITIGYTNSPNLTKLNLGVTASINFMEANDQGFSGSTRVSFIGDINHAQSETEKPGISFREVRVEQITLNVSSSRYSLAGSIQFFKNRPLYGNGFGGTINFSITDVFEGLSLNGMFGNNEFRYWYVDAAIPVSIPIGNGFAIKRIIGGISYHMNPQTSETDMTGSLKASLTGGSQIYTPDITKGVGFKAGVTVATTPKDEAFNADVIMSALFNSTGGLSTISLIGNAFAMESIAIRDITATENLNLYGAISMTYDNNNKSFHSVISATINYPNKLTGSGQMLVHTEPGYWQVCVGRPSNRVYVNIVNFVSANAYFMAGKNLEPMPPPHPIVANLVSSSRAPSALAGGDGFAAGAQYNFGINKSFTLSNKTNIGVGIAFNAVAGFDIMLARYNGYYCTGSTENIGFEKWHGQGQLYAGLQGSVYMTGSFLKQDFNVNIISGSVAGLLSGRAPKPSYFYGGMALQYSLLAGLIDGSFSFDYSVGNDCVITDKLPE